MLVGNRLVKLLYKSNLRYYMVSKDPQILIPSEQDLPQFSNRVIGIEPTHFNFNTETALDNALCKKDDKLTAVQIQEKVIHRRDIAEYI